MKYFCVNCNRELYRKAKTGQCGTCSRLARRGAHHTQETKEQISKTKILQGLGRHYKHCGECGKEIGYGTQSGLCMSCFKIQKREDFSGVVINGIVFKEYVGQDNGYQLWRMVCLCGDEFINNATRVKSGLVKSCGCLNKEHCKQLGQNQKGENNPSWIKDRSKTSLFIRNKDHKRNNKGSWQHFSKKAKKLQNYTCQLTNEYCKSSNLASHHIESVVLRPDLVVDINNIIVIKKEIHVLFHRLYGKKTTSVEWNKFLANEFLSLWGL